MSYQDLCHFCAPTTLLPAHIQGALFEKYSTSIHFYHLQHVEPILHDDCSPLAAQLREIHYLAEDQQCLKRVYLSHEFPHKIQQLAEYYKFSRDLPRPNDSNLIRTVQRYHDKLREFDFRLVKAAVKREQGISLTSCHQQSSLPDSNCQLKSRYSSVLHALDKEDDESDLLQDFCQQIDGAFPESQSNSAIKGFFPEASKKFQEFVEKEEKRSKEFCFKKRKNGREADKANKENTFKNGLNLIREPSKKSVMKGLHDKTRANDTLSRQEKVKKEKPFHRTIDCQRIFKPMSTGIIFQKQPPRTLEQIYKGNNQPHLKYNSAKEKKLSFQNTKKKKTINNHQSSKHKSVNRKSLLVKQNNYVLDTDRVVRENPKKSLTKASVHKSVEQSKRQPSLQSHKTLPLVQMKEAQQERLLSRSKSRSKISRQGSRQSIKIKAGISHTVSRFNESVSKQQAFSRDREEKVRMNRLLEKKLAI